MRVLAPAAAIHASKWASKQHRPGTDLPPPAATALQPTAVAPAPHNENQTHNVIDVDMEPVSERAITSEGLLP